MPDYSRVGAGHLAALMHRAMGRGDTVALAVLRVECARRPAADQEACRREWIQCARRRHEVRWRAMKPDLGGIPAARARVARVASRTPADGLLDRPAP